MNKAEEPIRQKKGNRQLYLFPLPIAEHSSPPDWLGPQCRDLLLRSKLVFAENERSARRFISSLRLGIRIEEITVERFDKDSEKAEAERLLGLIPEEGHALLMSDAGCPAVADPGAVLVDACHRLGVRVVPLTGPSSLLLALMASGLSGQQFSFHGYLPVDKAELTRKIRQLESESKKENRSQILIETPYRNAMIWSSLLAQLSDDTRLCFASGIGGPEEEIRQQKVRDWKKDRPVAWKKTPCIFLFMA